MNHIPVMYLRNMVVGQDLVTLVKLKAGIYGRE